MARPECRTAGHQEALSVGKRALTSSERAEDIPVHFQTVEIDSVSVDASRS